jgi:hypothetical protein
VKTFGSISEAAAALAADRAAAQRTLLARTAEFDCAPECEAELASNIGTGMFQGGFDVLKRQFGG